MRVLVHGDSLASGHERLRNAAAALAGRGHALAWNGDLAPPDAAAFGDPGPIERVRGIGQVARARAEVVIGGGPPAGPLARAAWLSGAATLLVGVPGSAPPRWTLGDRWCLGSVRSVTLRDEVVEETAAVDADAGPAHGWPESAPAPGPDPAHADAEHLERLAESLRSRRHGPAHRPAVFLDRDGTLVVERGYLSRAEDIELLPGVPVALRALQAAGFALVVVSNQSGVGRGLFTHASVVAAMARLRRELRRHGVELDGIYFCPHRPDEGCPCRKPATGLLVRAAAEHGLDPRRSAMIGDKLLDAATGQGAGALGILVRSGYGRDEAERAGAAEGGRPPDWIAEDLAEAAGWLIARDGAPAAETAPRKAAARSGRGWTLTPLG